MRIHVCVFLLCASSFALPQNPFMPAEQSAELPAQLKTQLLSIRDAALQDDYAYNQLAHLTDNIGPRPGGSLQAQSAVEYVAEQMRKLGLDVHLEEAMVRQWQRGTDLAELVAWPEQTPGTTQKIVVTALGGNTPTPPAGITADVVVVNNFAELQTLGRKNVSGKIVLFNFPYDKQKAANGHAGDAYGEAVAYRAMGAKAAAEMGAVAAVVRSVGNADYRIPHTGYSVPADIPAGAVTAEDAMLIARLASQGAVKLHLTLTSTEGPEVKSYNVIADLKGSEHPEQVVIVSGHLDSWDLGTGAIDDGAGVVVAMETAQLLVSLHLRPKRTLRVIAWMDEEHGGRGHNAYAKDYASDFVNHVAAIESDMGASHPLGFEVKAGAVGLAQLRPVAEILQAFGSNILEAVNYSPGADIAPLESAGVPVLGIMQDNRTYFNYHHTPADTLDKIVPQELRENAAAMAVMGYALAEMPDLLPR